MVPAALAILEEVSNGVTLHCSVESLDWIAYFLAGLDCPLIVHQPPELREALQRLATKIATMATSKDDG